MSSEKKNPIAILQEINVDKNDVIAIGVSKAEDMYNAELKKQLDAAKAVEKDIKENDKKLSDAANDVASKKYNDVCRKGSDAFASFHVTASWKVSSLDHAKKKVTVNLSIERGQGGYNNSFSFAETLDYTADMKNLVALNENLDTKLKEARAEAVNWRQKIAALPSLERKLRARLATQTLEETEEGKAFLAKFTMSDNDILALPNHVS